MTEHEPRHRRYTADEFIAIDQHVFGPGRYELLDGVPVELDALPPDHGAIVVTLAASVCRALTSADRDGRVETGTAVIPKSRSHDRVRLPHVLVGWSGKPTV